MSLESLAGIFQGGAGIPDRLPKVLKELQGLKISKVSGAAQDAKINLAAIRSRDTIISVLEFTKTAGNVTGITDRTGVTSIADVRASGTLTLGTVVANNTAQVNGKTYTFKVSPAENSLEVALGANAGEAAANLAARINAVDGYNTVIASANSNVVTVRAVAEGTSGNSITLVGGTNVTASGATLSGGTATGGISLSVATTDSDIVVVWYDKD